MFFPQGLKIHTEQQMRQSLMLAQVKGLQKDQTLGGATRADGREEERGKMGVDSRVQGKGAANLWQTSFRRFWMQQVALEE